MGPYGCGSLRVGGQPSAGRSRADCAASAEPTLPRRLSERDANSSGRIMGSAGRAGRPVNSAAAAASIILSRCSASKRSRSTASVFAAPCSSCDDSDVASDGTNVAADVRRSCLRPASRLSTPADGATPTDPTAADGGFGSRDVNACPGATAPGISPPRIAATSDPRPRSPTRRPGG